MNVVTMNSMIWYATNISAAPTAVILTAAGMRKNPPASMTDAKNMATITPTVPISIVGSILL